MENILFIAILLIGLFWLSKPKFKSDIKKEVNNVRNSVNKSVNKVSNTVSNAVNNVVNNIKNDFKPTQEDIQEDTYVDQTELITGFPYPQISSGVKRLSKGKSPFPLNNNDKFQPNGERDLKFIRHTDIPSNMTRDRMYLPDFYRKDRLSGNTMGTEELRKFELDNDKSDSSWSDENVSEHPKFYNADIKDELTNIGAFFDKNNQYNGKSSVNSEPLTTDRCYKNKNGDVFCEDYTRLQLIPPSLIKDPQSCYALNAVGMYKDMNLSNDVNDRVMNGGMFFGGIHASKEHNETFSKPISPQVGSCAF